jgi:hypothetical protein
MANNGESAYGACVCSLLSLVPAAGAQRALTARTICPCAFAAPSVARFRAHPHPLDGAALIGTKLSAGEPAGQ